MSSVGARGGSAGNTGIVFMRLKPRERAEGLGGRGHRGAAAEARADPGHPRLPAEPAADPDRRPAHEEPLPVHAAGRRHGRAVRVRAAVSRRRCAACPGFQDVTSDLQIAEPAGRRRHRPRPGRRARRLTPQQIEDGPLHRLRLAADLARSTRRTTSTRSSWSSRPSTRRDPAALSLLYVRSRDGHARAARRRRDARARTSGRSSVNHSGQLPSVTISFNLKPGRLARATRSARSTASARGDACRRRSRTSFQGTAQAFQSSLQGLGLLLLMAILVIYMVLGILYESFIHPLTILSALPFAGFGALLTLLVFRDGAATSTPSSASSCSSAWSRRTGS